MHTYMYLAKLFHLEGLAAGTYGHARGVLFIWYFDGSFLSIIIYINIYRAVYTNNHTYAQKQGAFIMQITQNRRREKKNKKTTRER